jgi:hypothetical protein
MVFLQRSDRRFLGNWVAQYKGRPVGALDVAMRLA